MTETLIDGDDVNLDMTQPVNLAFVFCVESGWLEPQAVMLAQSIRRFAGKFGDRPIIAIKPRAGAPLLTETIASFGQLDVTYLDIDLNVEMREDNYANKALAAAYVEEKFDYSKLVFLDTDTVFLKEPVELDLLRRHDGLFRPPDGRGVCASPDDGAYSDYWARLCELEGIGLDRLEPMRAFVGRQLVNANFNGGFLAVNADLGVFQRWRELMYESWRRSLSPEPGNFWGWDQATFSVAVHAKGFDYQLLPSAYNYPLQCHDLLVAEGLGRAAAADGLVHCHYHSLFEPEKLEENPLVNGSLQVEKGFSAFLNEFAAHPVVAKTYAWASRRA